MRSDDRVAEYPTVFNGLQFNVMITESLLDSNNVIITRTTRTLTGQSDTYDIS